MENEFNFETFKRIHRIQSMYDLHKELFCKIHDIEYIKTPLTVAEFIEYEDLLHNYFVNLKNQ